MGVRTPAYKICHRLDGAAHAFLLLALVLMSTKQRCSHLLSHLIVVRKMALLNHLVQYQVCVNKYL